MPTRRRHRDRFCRPRFRFSPYILLVLLGALDTPRTRAQEANEVDFEALESRFREYSPSAIIVQANVALFLLPLVFGYLLTSHRKPRDSASTLSFQPRLERVEQKRQHVLLGELFRRGCPA